MNTSILIEFQKIDSQKAYELAIITLNRPEKANALDEFMISNLLEALSQVREREQVRLLVLRGQGKHFCAGADLNWMKRASQMSYEENLQDAERLAKVFESLSNLRIPTLALVHGQASGGALGLIASCDLSIAVDSASFHLKEVRVGLLPAMIMPYLLNRMSKASFLHFGLTGLSFTAEEALKSGLLTQVCSESALSSTLRKLLNELLLASPHSQQEFKRLWRVLSRESSKMQFTCIEAIAKSRTSTEGQKGLHAVLSKSEPEWVQKLGEDWKIS